jgi:hypothetical protein
MLRRLAIFVITLAVCRTAQATLYFPHTTSRTGWSTDICVVNTSGTDTIRGTFRAFSDAGIMLAESAVVTLAPNARTLRGLTDLFPAVAADVGHVTFETPAISVSGLARVGTPGVAVAAIAAAAKPNAGDFYITHIASLSNWWTGISLVNTTPYAKQVVVEFNNGASKTVDLPAHGRFYSGIAEWFDGKPQPALESAVVKNGAGVVGSELFGSTNTTGPSLLDGILLEDETTTRIFFPHLVTSDIWWTGIVVFNPSAIDCTLRIIPHRTDGTALTAIVRTLRPRQRYIGLLSTLGLPSDAAWLEIEASVPVTGFELFATNDGQTMAGYTGVNISARNGIFPIVEKLAYTGIAFVNVSGTRANVTLIACDDQGQTIASTPMQVAPYASKLGFTFELFGAGVTNYTSVRYTSDQPLVAFSLNLEAGLRTLDGFAAGIRSRSVSVPDGSVGYGAGVVAAPGATIVSQGQTFTNAAALAPEALAAVIRNGKTYLYHPALGTAPLSDQNSRRAVGYFIVGMSGGDAVSAAGAFRPQGVFPGGADRVSMKTGVDLSYEGQDTALLIRAVNGTRRWAAALGDTPGETARYLPLRASTVPSEYFEFVDKIGEYLEWGTIKIIGTETGAQVRANPAGTVKTYGAFWRAVPWYKSRGLPPELLGINPDDAKILATLTTVDMFYFIAEGIRAIVGVASPSECADIVLQSGVPRFVETIFIQWITGDDGAVEQLHDTTLKSTLHSFIGCCAKLATVGAAEGVNTLLDILTFANWIIEDGMFTTYHSVMSYSPFETVRLGSNAFAITSATVTPAAALESGKTGQVTLRCTTRGVAILQADLSAIGGPIAVDFVKGGKDPATQDDIWTTASAVSVLPRVPGDRQVKFTGSGSTGSVAVYATVRVNLVITNADATGDLVVSRRGFVTVSCTSLGAASVVADLSAIGGPATLELYGSADTGSYSRGNLEVTPPLAGTKTIRFTASANGVTAQGTATIVVKSGELEFSGNMTVERTITTSSSYGCVVTGSCSGVLPLTLTLHENGAVTARTSLPLLPIAQADCSVPRLTCEVKVVQLENFTGTHDGKGNFNFYFWRVLSEAPELGEFKVTGTHTSQEARGSGEKAVPGDGAWQVKVSFVLK